MEKEGIGIICDYDFFILVGIGILLPFAVLGGVHMSWIIFKRAPSIYLPYWFKIVIFIIIFSALGLILN